MADCVCGRPADTATVTVFRSLRGVYHYHRCLCGLEWTEYEPRPDHSIAISGDEVIEVHELLKEFHGTLRVLLGDQAA